MLSLPVFHYINYQYMQLKLNLKLGDSESSLETRVPIYYRFIVHATRNKIALWFVLFKITLMAMRVVFMKSLRSRDANLDGCIPLDHLHEMCCYLFPATFYFFLDLLIYIFLYQNWNY